MRKCAYHAGGERNSSFGIVELILGGYDHPVTVKTASSTYPTVQELIDWLDSQGVKVGMASNLVTSDTLASLFSATFYFTDVNDAILFKLTWGGS